MVLSYVLCDKSVGFVFTDCTKLALMLNGHNIQYTDQKGCEMYFTVSRFDKEDETALYVLQALRGSKEDWCIYAGTRVRLSTCPLQLDML